MRIARVGLAGGIGVLIGLAAFEARGAAGEERPLLVTVEIEPGIGADAAQVRRAIAAELGRPVVALAASGGGQAPSASDPDVLLVSVDRERVVLSMRRRSDETVARALPVPAERGARLRAIAWLAGNLARDQASPLLATMGDAEPAGAPAAALAPPTEPPPVAAPPPPSAPAPAGEIWAAGPAPVEGVARPWSVLLSTGPGTDLDRLRSFQKAGIFLQLEVVKRRPDRWMWGLGADYSVEAGESGGAFVLGGREARWSRVRLDATLGLGLENATVYSSTTTVNTPPDGQPQSGEATTTSSSKLAPFGRVFASASLALGASWDLVLRGGAHLNGANDMTFLSAVGLRYNIP